MSTCSRVGIALALTVALGCGGDSPDGAENASSASPAAAARGSSPAEAFGFGRSADAAAVAAADIDVRFDGAGLPPGAGDAATGEALYGARCVGCHGAQLEGDPSLGARPLVGDVRHAVNNLPFAPPLFAYIRRAMPLDSPGSLADDEVYALVAFLLERAGVADLAGRPLDAATLAAVAMPNREAFFITDGVATTVPAAPAANPQTP